jgi:hypothetical protein
MDPYLEDPAYWSDFHHEFISALRQSIVTNLPPNYVAKIDEHVTIVDPEVRKERLVKPDVTVTHKAGAGKRGGTAVVEVDDELEPQTLSNVVYLDPITQGYIQIRRRSDQALVTVIEVLSPANKNGGRGQYLDKRELLLRQPVGVVELDLLRGGDRLAFSSSLPEGDYHGFISRADRRPGCDVYSWSLRRRLPVLPIPLKPEDGDIKVNLQDAFNTAFERGGYAGMIDYSAPPPEPKFSDEDLEWVLRMVRDAKAT